MTPKPYHPQIVQVSLPVPVGDFFDYLCPSDASVPAIGVRVLVPFGRRQLIGIVIAHTTSSEVPISKLKPIRAVLDNHPLIDADLIQLAEWLKGYYHHPLGDVLSVMLPALINQGKPITRTHQYYTLCTPIDKALTQISPSAKKQLALLQLLDECDKLNTTADTTLFTQHGISAASVRALLAKGLVTCHTDEKPLGAITDNQTPQPIALKQAPLLPNSEQAAALLTIQSAIDSGEYHGFLLNGVTGSGKTEVYLQAMAHVLAQGKQVLILIPEIGLTPQTADRFAARFDTPITVLHSNLSDKERLTGWLDARSGAARIVIGTRSSVLYPFADLGLIIIDEAHDSSYKQQDHLRYHASDVAMVRASFKKIPIILGTATPSLEHYKLVKDGKLKALSLSIRAGTAKSATMQLIDMRSTQYTLHTDGQMSDTTLAPDTVQAMRETLARGEQVLVFLNRRGYAPIMICGACGYQADCPHCDAHLTVHKSGGHAQGQSSSYQRTWLKCHHCGYQAAAPHACPSCHSGNMDSVGTGTTRLTEHLHALFANPQTSATPYPIYQIDRDTMRKKGAWEALSARIHSGEPAILVGTQMIAKGHHFPDVTLVVIANADLGFLSPDFRSPEHTAQRIIQVAGRAGRAEKAGKVFIQTLKPEHPLLNQLIKDGYDAFAHDLLAERRLLALPPFSHAALIRAESVHYSDAKAAIMALKNSLPRQHPFAINAPIDAPMTKKNNRYQVQLLILSKTRPPLHEFLNAWWQHAQSLPECRKVRLSLDIDPMGW